jgi:hypothetical protein
MRRRVATSLFETGNVTANGSAASPGRRSNTSARSKGPLYCLPCSLSKLHIGANAQPTPVRQAPYIDRLAHAVAPEEALRDAVATKGDIAEVKHVIQLAVRDMTIRESAIVVALLAALATIKFFA